MTNLNILDIKFLRQVVFKLLSLISLYKEYKKYKKNEEKLILNFFNFHIPCHPSIKQCEELRKEFVNEVYQVKKKTCTGCILSHIKYKYVKKLLAAQN